MINELTLKSYEYLMIETFKRIEDNKNYDVNFKPYSKELLENLLRFFEEREEYEKCEMLKHKRDDSIEIMENKTI
jgi:hypothetical protein